MRSCPGTGTGGDTTTGDSDTATHVRWRYDDRWGYDDGGGTGTGGGTTGRLGRWCWQTAGGGDGGDNGSGDNAPDGGGGGASCDGFKNGPGITDTEITIGNASDISGPVPGLFESSQDAVKAYVAYFNASSDICGRKLEAGHLRQPHRRGRRPAELRQGCGETFAMVGSMSAFDSGGAATAQSCGLPDIRSAAVTRDRNACTTCFPAQSVNAGEWENAARRVHQAELPGRRGTRCGLFYLNAGAAAENGPVEAAAG